MESFDHRLLKVLQDALDLDPAERARLVETECGDDKALRTRAQEILGSEERTTAFIARAGVRSQSR